MKTAKIEFKMCDQNSQNLGSSEEHMVSRIIFDLEINGQRYPSVYVDVKQTVGGSFQNDALEVGKPMGYKGPFNHDAFRLLVEEYYRGLVGSQGSGISVLGGGKVLMRDNIFVKPWVVTMEIGEGNAGW